MQTKLEKLKTILGEVNDLNAAAALLGWDQQTYMPPEGALARSYQLATLSSIAHDKFTSPEVGRLLEEVQPYVDQLDPDSDDARLVRVTRREYRKATCVPIELVAELARETTTAFSVWQEARAENDFARFRPHLEKIVELRRRYAELFAPYDHIYDPLLDDYEPGMKTADVKAIFDVLRPRQVALIQAISGRPQVDDSFMHQHFDEQKQWEFGVEVITRFGYDWQRARQDKSAHPFTTNFSIDDVRITTRILPDYFPSAFFSSTHEAGHALYELGIDRALERTPLTGGASLAVHESQSRLWENLVGRSLPFWEYYYPRLQKIFPSQFNGVSLQAFYKGINKVEPSLIRVEADEATYNLHIMLRLELEIALMEGSLAVKDLPEAWNARMQEYLGITPPNDAQGVLQDVHWSGGSIGYFATYALGNLISVQLWQKANQDIPDLADQIRRGEFSALLGWLRQNVHRHGRKFEPQELVERVTGSKIDPQPYLQYLQDKFGQIYGL
jgi:carboxypeptidase Taq